MHYSLIVGVKTCKFSITLDGEESQEHQDGNDAEGSDEDADQEVSALASGPAASPGKAEKGKHYATYGAKSVSGPAIYYMGIVDFLQDWTTRKKCERLGKIYLFGQEAEGTSVMHPDPYKTRFQNKMDEIFDLEMLESRRKNRLKNKFKKGVPAVVDEKRPISGRAIAPAGTTLNKNKSAMGGASMKKYRNSDGMMSVGFVDVPEEDMEEETTASVEAAVPQTTRPFGGNGGGNSTQNPMQMGAENVSTTETDSPATAATAKKNKKGKKGQLKKGNFQEFSDVDI
jgi:hypothetical protein